MLLLDNFLKINIFETLINYITLLKNKLQVLIFESNFLKVLIFWSSTFKFQHSQNNILKVSMLFVVKVIQQGTSWKWRKLWEVFVILCAPDCSINGNTTWKKSEAVPHLGSNARPPRVILQAKDRNQDTCTLVVGRDGFELHRHQFFDKNDAPRRELVFGT